MAKNIGKKGVKGSICRCPVLQSLHYHMKSEGLSCKTGNLYQPTAKLSSSAGCGLLELATLRRNSLYEHAMLLPIGVPPLLHISGNTARGVQFRQPNLPQHRRTLLPHHPSSDFPCPAAALKSLERHITSAAHGFPGIWIDAFNPGL